MQNLDIDDMLDKKEKIYVKNNATKHNMLLVLEIRDSHGKSKPLSIPPTNVPFCLSERFSSDAIRQCNDLRAMIEKQVLILMDPKEAKAELARPEIREEQKALKMSVFANNAPRTAMSDSLAKLSKPASPVVSSKDLLKSQESANVELHSRLKGIILSFQSKEKPSKETVIQLRRLQTGFKEADFAYILSQCRDDTNIREFAEKGLKNLSAAQEVEGDEGSEE